MVAKKHKKQHDTKNTHAYDNAILNWRAPEYVHHEKSILWFIIAGVIAAGFVVYDLMSGGWSFSIAIIVFCGTYYLFYRHSPNIVEVKISKMGIKIGRHCFPYSHLKSFWIVYDPPFVKKLYFRMSSKFKPDISIALEEFTDPTELRTVLSSHLTENKGQHEPLADTLVRVFRL